MQTAPTKSAAISILSVEVGGEAPKGEVPKPLHPRAILGLFKATYLLPPDIYNP